MWNMSLKTCSITTNKDNFIIYKILPIHKILILTILGTGGEDYYPHFTRRKHYSSRVTCKFTQLESAKSKLNLQSSTQTLLCHL